MSAGKCRTRLLQHGKCSEVVSGALDSDEVRQALARLRQIVQSAYGPTGRLKFFQNSSGGHVTMTSMSRRVINSLLTTSHPVVRLLLTAVKGHLDVYCDGGLRTALLALSLIESSQSLTVPRHLVIELHEHALHTIIQHLDSDLCRWKMKVDFGDMKSMLAVVNSIIGTKPACHLHDHEKTFLSVLLLKAFAQSLPSSSTANKLKAFPVQIMVCEGSSIQESQLLNGVLIEAPEFPTLTNKHVFEAQPIKVALYNVSMAGDTQEWFDGITTETSPGVLGIDITEAVLRQMLLAAEELVSCGVKLVTCQKCMHPALKEYLRDRDVFVIDRLSILHVGAVQRLTGATVLGTFTRDVPASCFGSVQKIEHLVLNERSYLQLLPVSSARSPSVSTLLLCSSDESSLEELKLVCQAVISTLHEIVYKPYVVSGGGCLDTHLASFLRHYSRTCGDEVTRKFGCSKAQLRTVIDNVAKCMETQARSLEHDGNDHVIDSANQHHWVTPSGTRQMRPDGERCSCNLVSRDQSEVEWRTMGEYDNGEVFDCRKLSEDFKSERRFDDAVLDTYSVKLNSLKTAFETANIILRISYLVGDKSHS